MLPTPDSDGGPSDGGSRGGNNDVPSKEGGACERDSSGGSVGSSPIGVHSLNGTAPCGVTLLNERL